MSDSTIRGSHWLLVWNFNAIEDMMRNWGRELVAKLVALLDKCINQANLNDLSFEVNSFHDLIEEIRKAHFSASSLTEHLVMLDGRVKTLD